MCVINTVQKYKLYFLVMLAFILYYVVTNHLFGYISPSMIILGLPCPGCGLTRAGVLFFTGQFQQSFVMHPLFVPVLIFVICLVVCELIWPNKLKYMQIPAVLLICTSLIVYVLRMVFLFPDYPPMVVNENAILFDIINIIKKE